MTVHNPMPFELKVSNVVSDIYRLFDVFFLRFICMSVNTEIPYSVIYSFIYSRVYYVRELIMSVIQLVYHYLQNRDHSP